MILRGHRSEDTTVVGLIVSAIRRDISFGVLVPDAKLKIDGLRASYGGSNHSIREALRVLAAEGLVEAEAQRGFRVASATEYDLQDIARMRLEIEVIGLSWSVKKGDVVWESTVVAAHHRLNRLEAVVAENPSDLNALEWDEAVRSFFATLVAACESPRLIEAQQKYFDQSRRIRLAALRDGRLDFARRPARRQILVDTVLRRETDGIRALLSADIEAELNGEHTVQQDETKVTPEETHDKF